MKTKQEKLLLEAVEEEQKEEKEKEKGKRKNC
jgi:hypothetical protein